MTLSVIIVSYNVSKHLKQCISSIYKSDIKNKIKIIIIDNHSYDDTSKMIKSHFPDIKYIQNNKNLGFSKAVNKGFKYVETDYICLLNPDTIVSDDTFRILMNYLECNTHVGIVGPKILNANGSLQLSSKRSFPSLLSSVFKMLGLSKIFPNSKIYSKYNLTYLDENEMHQVDSVSGACMMFSTNVKKKIGLFDEIFFMYSEDLDYCYRCKKNGYDVIYNPNARIMHFKGESSRLAPYDMVNIFYSSMHLFFKKHKKDFIAWKLASPLVYILINCRKIISYFMIFSKMLTTFFLDVLTIMVTFFMSSFIWLSFYHLKILELNLFINIMPLFINIICSWIVSSLIMKLYKNDCFSYGRSITTTFIAFIISAASTYLIGTIAFSRAILMMTFLFSGIISSLWRILIYYLFINGKIKFNSNSSLIFRRALILGTSPESIRIGRELESCSDSNYLFIGFVDYLNKYNSNRFLGRVSEIKHIIKKHNINEIIIPESWGDINRIITIIDEINKSNVNLKFISKGSKFLIGRGEIEKISDISLLPLGLPLFEKYNYYFKRFFDFIFSFLLIILSLPIQVYFSFLNKKKYYKIWIKGSKKIEIFNYNSNINIIKYLPLLIYVMKGQLSLVGSEIVEADKIDPKYLIKPGLTGLKKIEGEKHLIKKFDEYYALNYSLFFDLEIMIKTVLRF